MESESFNSCSKLVELTDAHKTEDDTLIIIVNEDGTISVDPSTLQKLLASQPNQNSRLSVVSVDSATYDDPPKTEAPDHANVATTSANNAPGNYHLVDPFLDLDQEELQKLESALKSEKGRQILGENVAAMLDMLNKEGETHIAEGTHISQNIHNDHCYSATTSNKSSSPSASTVQAKSATLNSPKTYALNTQNVKVVQRNATLGQDKKQLKQTTLGTQFKLVQTPGGGTQVILQKDGQQSLLKATPTVQKLTNAAVHTRVEDEMVKAMESITTSSTSDKAASRSQTVVKASPLIPPLPPSKYPRRENRRPPAHLLNEEYETPLASPVTTQPTARFPVSHSTTAHQQSAADQKISALDLLESIHAAIDMDIGGTPSSDDEESEVSFCKEIVN